MPYDRGMIRIVAKELIFLGTLFFVIVPFVMSMTDDYAARHGATTPSAAFSSLSISSGSGSYISGQPIYLSRD